ncbi:MAG: BrnT family toxin [Bryobacteraceae bacterium]
MERQFEHRFEWDPAKALRNAREHGVSFERAATVFLDPRAMSIFRTPDVAGHFSGIGENSLTQPTGNRCGKPGGTDDCFLSSVRLLLPGEDSTDHEKRWSVPPLGHRIPAQPKFRDVRSSDIRR